MVRDNDELVQRRHHHAMVDEVDSVLVDDARTPLTISGPVPQGLEEQEYLELNPKIENLFSVQRQLATEYLAEAKRLIKDGNTGHNEGEGGMALFRVYRALPKYRPRINFLSEDGIKVILQKTENFFMQEQNKNMHVADAPLYFTIDEKNRSVELTDKGIEYLSKGENDVNFFVMPDIDAALEAPAMQAYDYIIIDCPPSLGILTMNAMVAAQSLLVPLQCEFFALEGLSQLLNTVERVCAGYNQRLNIIGVVLTMYDKRNRLSEQVAADVRAVLVKVVFETVISAQRPPV